MRQPKFVLFPVLLLVLSVRVFAQAVRWDPPGGQLGFNQVSQLTLTFEGCEPELDQFKLPRVDGLVFGQPSQSSSTQIVNFKMSRQFSLVFPIRPATRSPITIPAFDVPTDKGALRVAAANFTVGDATVGSSGLALDDIAAARFTLPKDTLWAGEVVPVSYTLTVVRRYFHSLAGGVEWQPAPFVIEEWSKPEQSPDVMLRGERRLVATQNTRGYFKSAGNFTLKPASQVANLVVGSSGFGFFTTPTVEQRALTTEPLALTVKPLPPAPAGFSGAVGQFALVSKIVPTAPAVGEPVTWTLELTGTGNWPDIPGLPAREVSNDFSVVQPKSKRTMKDNALFEGTLAEDVVLVPTKAGRYTLGPLCFTYFDTVSGTYKTITTEAVTLTVGPGGAAPAAPAATNGPVQFSLPPLSQPAAPTLPVAVPPVAPESLPRDVLKEPASGLVPFHPPPLALLCVLAAALPPGLLWLVLAALRSRRLDPRRPRREARAALVRLLADLRSSGPQLSTLHSQPSATSNSRPSALHSQLLRSWQHHTAALWEVPHAAPGAALLQASVAARQGDAPLWAALWDEADRTLHGKSAPLPPDWNDRFDAALAAVKIPGWTPFSLFSPRALLPFLEKSEALKTEGLNQVLKVSSWIVILLSLIALPPSVLGAESPADAYKRGDFAAAEKGWRTALAAAPTDWTTRHNLGLALAQQDRWAEATAEWAGAFLLNSRSEATRWDLTLGLQRSGLAPAELVEFSHGEGRHALARAASPAEWQFILIGASLLIAAALAVLLLHAYGRAGAWARPTALSAILLAILVAAAATFSLRTYGLLADPEAIMVWRAATLRSIPTEADTAQKTSPLSAGSLATVDKTFLGWSRLAFPGGQTGWVRTEDTVRLYR